MIVRVTEPGRPSFQLRKGVSVFIMDAVDPPLGVAEILEEFRSGSTLAAISVSDIEARDLSVVPIAGAGGLAPQVRAAHAEIRPGPGMSRPSFKSALKELD